MENHEVTIRTKQPNSKHSLTHETHTAEKKKTNHRANEKDRRTMEGKPGGMRVHAKKKIEEIAWIREFGKIRIANWMWQARQECESGCRLHKIGIMFYKYYINLRNGIMIRFLAVVNIIYLSEHFNLWDYSFM